MTKLEQLLAANKAANKNDWRDEVIEMMSRRLKIISSTYRGYVDADDVANRAINKAEKIAKKALEK